MSGDDICQKNTVFHQKLMENDQISGIGAWSVLCQCTGPAAEEAGKHWFFGSKFKLLLSHPRLPRGGWGGPGDTGD